MSAPGSTFHPHYSEGKKGEGKGEEGKAERETREKDGEILAGKY